MQTSIIILNWNGRKHLETCLKSLFNQTYKDFEVIFVDNGSTDDSVSFVKDNFPKVQIIETGKNLGFAEGNNVGIRKALENKDIKYIVALNNDTEVKEDWLEQLVKAAEIDEHIGACASKLLYYNDRTIIDSAGDFYYFGSMKVVPRGHGQKDSYFKLEECLTPCAAATLYRRKALEQVKLGNDYYDSDYFAYIEDSDLGLRIRLGGWKCMFVPDAVVYHKVSATSSQWKSDFKKYHSVRNRILTAIKIYPVRLWPRVFKNPVTHQSKSGTGDAIRLFLRVFGSVLVTLPRMIQKRSLIKRLPGYTKDVFREWQEKYSIKQ